MHTGHRAVLSCCAYFEDRPSRSVPHHHSARSNATIAHPPTMAEELPSGFDATGARAPAVVPSASGGAAYTPLSVGRAKQGVDKHTSGPATLFLNRPMSTEDRVILSFIPSFWCSVGTGLDNEALSTVPPLLAARGVTPEEWRTHTDRLVSVVQPWSTCIWGKVLGWMSVLGVPCVCAREAAYQKKLASWLHQLNTEVLMPRGMYAKFQTSQITADKHHEEISWLAIAMSETEIEALQREPVFWRPMCCEPNIAPDRCACCLSTCCCRSVV